MRVVSLVPAATEILFALGVEPVGRSHECDYPQNATELPVVVTTKIDDTGTSREINAQVAEANSNIFEINRTLLYDLQPDLIIAQGMCEVCAVDQIQVRDILDDLNLTCPILTIDPHTIADIFQEITRIGRAVNRPHAAAEVVSALRTRIDETATKIPTTKPSVAVLDWLAPIMIAGHWVPEVITHAGGHYPLADPGAMSRPRSWAELTHADPDVLIVAPCGFDLTQTRQNIDDLVTQEGYESLTAVSRGEIYAIDGNHLLNRPGPRVIDTIELVFNLIHPGQSPSDLSEYVIQIDHHLIQ